MWHVYILECGDGSLYTGITDNVQRRFAVHKNGKGGRYTHSRGVKRILYTKQYKTRGKALKREAEIKSWSRERKLNLINSN